MMNKRLNPEDAFNAIKEVEKDYNIPSKSVFTQNVKLNRILFNKLKLMGFVIDKSRNHIIKSLLASRINEFESENGSRILLAKTKIKEKNSETSKTMIKNFKSIPEA
jgi:hypothetical protein